MIELRKDYILDRWVILAPSRKKRPRDFTRQSAAASSSICVFCKGNEKFTPPEIGRILDSNGEWLMRWFPNLFSAVEEDGPPQPRTDNTFYTFSAAYGRHEIIAETPLHEMHLWDFTGSEISKLLHVYSERISELEKAGAKYVSVFKNHGLEGGASIAHSHSQVVSINTLPPLVREEAAAMKNYGSCPYCSIIGAEKNSYRRCFENEHAVAFTPYASRFNFEVWIFPKRHVRQLADLTSEDIMGVSDLLALTLHKLKELNAPYNYVLHYLPSSEPGDFHFHIEVQPRLSIWAGFELNTEIIINSVTPEDAARFYRGEE